MTDISFFREGKRVFVSEENPLPTSGSGAAVDETRLLPETIGTNGQVAKVVDGAVAWAADANTTYSTLTQAQVENNTSTAAGLVTGQRLAQAVTAHAPQAAFVDVDGTDLATLTASVTAIRDALVAAGLMAGA